ncbi:MAG: hypothetical protein JWM68_4439, partial [Verrucomicrobiales bacterium]|nr:hypothetical protein [Verrucomicrobiales bacterium]
WVLKLYKEILIQVSEGKTSDIAQFLINGDKWRLKERAEKPNTKFTTETNTFIILRDCLANAVVCKICGARVHRNSLQIDHIQRREDGGSGESDNGQMTHPFCNTTYKETQVRRDKASHVLQT